MLRDEVFYCHPLCSQHPIRPHTWDEYTTLRKDKTTCCEDVDMASLNSTNKLYYCKDVPWEHGHVTMQEWGEERVWPMGPPWEMIHICWYLPYEKWARNDAPMCNLTDEQIAQWVDGASVWWSMIGYYGDGMDGMGQDEHAWRHYYAESSTGTTSRFAELHGVSRSQRKREHDERVQEIRDWPCHGMLEVSKEELMDCIADWVDEVNECAMRHKRQLPPPHPRAKRRKPKKQKVDHAQ